MDEIENNNREKSDHRLRALVNAGTELLGGASASAAGTVIGFLLGGPVGAVAGGTVGAATSMAVKTIGRELSSRVLSPGEQKRIGAVFTLAAAEIIDRSEKGEKVRDDGFL